MNGTDWILHCVCSPTQRALASSPEGERKERAIKAEGAQKSKLNLIWFIGHSTCYKGRLSVPVPLHMAVSEYKIEMRGCWSQEMGVWFGRDVFRIDRLWHVRAKAAVSTRLVSGALMSSV